MARTASPHFSASLNKDGCSRAVHSLLRDRAQQAVLSNAPGQGTAGPSIPMLRDRAQQSRPSLCSGTGRSRPSIPMLRNRAPESEEIPPEPCPYAHGRPESTETAASPRREREKCPGISRSQYQNIHKSRLLRCERDSFAESSRSEHKYGPTSQNLRCERDNSTELSRSQ